MGCKKLRAKEGYVIQKEKITGCLFSFWVTMTLVLDPTFCNPHFGPSFSGSQTDPYFQNKNRGFRLTRKLYSKRISESLQGLNKPTRLQNNLSPNLFLFLKLLCYILWRLFYFTNSRLRSLTLRIRNKTQRERQTVFWRA